MNFDLQSHLNILVSELLCRGNSRGKETYYLWQRSTPKKLVFDLSETYICHGGSYLLIFTSEHHLPKKKLSSFFCTEKRC